MGLEMTTPGRRSYDRWRPKVIAALASGQTSDEAARIGRVSASTVDRWRRDHRFVTLVEEARNAIVERLVGTAADLGPKHIRNLDRLATDPAVPASVQRAASSAILDQLSRYRESVSFASELAQLRSKVERLIGGHRTELPAPAVRIVEDES